MARISVLSCIYVLPYVLEAGPWEQVAHRGKLVETKNLSVLQEAGGSGRKRNV